jgi:cytochrome oxidase Cu insertion factor (SCO1/SenC/PrrC family)
MMEERSSSMWRDQGRRRRIRYACSIALGVSLLAFAPRLGARHQPTASAATVDVATIGPKIGDPLPDFSLPDQSGHVRTLKSLLGPKGAVIVFFRSADW